MAQTAEAVGFDSIWLGDHLLYDLEIGPRGPWEVWTSLAALAASTERVLLGPLVASAGFHEPAMLAKQAATVDGISGGRLILGLGSGWNEREYRAFGFPFDRRVESLRRSVHDHPHLAGGRRDRFHRRVLPGRPLRAAPPRRSAGWPAVDGRVDAAADAVDHASATSTAWNVWWSDYGNTPAGFAELKANVDDQALQHGRQAGSVVGDLRRVHPTSRWRRSADGWVRRFTRRAGARHSRRSGRTAQGVRRRRGRSRSARRRSDHA